MSLFVPETVPAANPAQKPLHFVPPTTRERRAQAIHRLQVGLFGIAGMLLLVGLANIIMENARISDSAPAAATVAATTAARVSTGAPSAKAANDPLADIGVVPDLPASGETTAADLPPPANSAAAPTPAVPRR